MRRKFIMIPQNGKLFSKMTAEPYKSFLKFEWYLLISTCTIFKLSCRPIVRLFDGLTDRMENRRENQAVGAHSQTIGCDFEESDGIGRTLTCQTRSDYSFLSLHKIHYGINITKIVSDRLGSGNEKFDHESEQYESHQNMSFNTNAIKLFKIGQWDTSFS